MTRFCKLTALLLTICLLLSLPACGRKTLAEGPISGPQEVLFNETGRPENTFPEESPQALPSVESAPPSSPQPQPGNVSGAGKYTMFLGTNFEIYDYDSLSRNIEATQSLLEWVGSDPSDADIEAAMWQHGVDPAPYLNGTGFAYGFDQYSFDPSMREEIVMDPTGKYDPYLYMNQNYDALVAACSKYLAEDGSIYDRAMQELDLALTDSYYSWFENFEAALPREITLVMLQHGVNPEPYLESLT